MSVEFRKTDLPKVCMKSRQKSLYKSSLSFSVGAFCPLVSSGDTAVQSIKTLCDFCHLLFLVPGSRGAIILRWDHPWHNVVTEVQVSWGVGPALFAALHPIRRDGKVGHWYLYSERSSLESYTESTRAYIFF